MRFIYLTFLLWTGAAFAQSYPSHDSTTVNDFANLLNAADKAALSAQLDKLKQETGVEMAVLTLDTQSDYAPDLTLEQFATGLFNNWGIGDAQRNDGVLVLILRTDRAIRIELGAAYAREWDRIAQQVVDDHFLVAFAAGKYPQGIKEGSAAVIAGLIRPYLAGADAPKSNSDNREVWIIVAIFALFTALNKRQAIGDGLARFRTCPRCGKRGLRQNHKTTVSASRTMVGHGIRRVRCTHCDYEEKSSYSIPQRSAKSPGGFGGGSSGGGGASGRW